MQYRKILLSGVLCLFFLAAFAQTSAQFGSVSGNIRDRAGVPLPGASVKVKGSRTGISADQDGSFLLTKITPGKHTLEISAVGFSAKQKEFSIKPGETIRFSFVLDPVVGQMESVAVIGRTANQEANRQAYAVTSIDAKPLHNSSQDLNQVLGKTAGVRVREDGGLGSGFNFSLNGFSGKQVKFFMDGIPMDNFGSSLTLNNIPINLADRIEVYKGVIPIWLGADALGGAVNIVTNTRVRNFLDASYSFGSFNTHRSTISTGYTHEKTGITILANVFQNYSDNNYWVNTGVTDFVTQVVSAPKRLRRFHDRYKSETVQLEVGVTGKKYADRLMFGVILSQNEKEIQTGAQMSKVFGDWHQNSTTVMPTLKYKKTDLLVKGLNLNLYGTYNLGHTQNIDTINRIYNWKGEMVDNSRNEQGNYVPGGESSRSFYKFRNNLALANGNLSYAFMPGHSIGVNYVVSSFDRKGHDVLRPNEEAYEKPQRLEKTTMALGYKFDYANRWSTSLFTKHYKVKGESAQKVDIYANPRWEAVYNNFSSTGYGVASAYFLYSFLQVKGSYEKTYRLPEGDEMFGDGINHVANKNLRPEKSNNLNLGVVFSHKSGDRHRFLFETNFIYRDASDFIRIDVVDTRTQSVNIRGVKNTGFDADIKYAYGDLFTAGANVTYQHLINTTKFEPPGSSYVSELYKDKIPNMPYLFGNLDLGLKLKKVGFSHATLGLNYHLNYVEEYYLKWPRYGTRNGKNNIPQQVSHDFSATFSVKNGRYNISAECRNLTDVQLYDNFMMQKPGRAIYLKLRYFIRKH